MKVFEISLSEHAHRLLQPRPVKAVAWRKRGCERVIDGRFPLLQD
jgi:hypothetical protein